MATKWWENEPLTISAVQCKFEDDDFWTLNEYVAKSGFNVEQMLHLISNGQMAYYSEAKHGKKLDEYLKQSRKHGIREIIYYNTHCITADMLREHPDWAQLRKDGSIMPAYNIYMMNCVNSSWFDSYAQDIADLCRHDIDGIFLDGPIMRDDGCYCEVCKKKFQDRFGKSIYEGTRLELQAMRVDSVTEYVKKTHDIVKGINPDILLYLNNSALRADITGNNSRLVEPYVDMLGAEGGFVRVDHTTSLWAVSSKAKHIETVAKGKPTVTFLAGNLSGMAYYMHTPEQTTIFYAQSYANGANVWYGIHGSASAFKDSAGSKAGIEFNRFVESHRDIFAKSTSPARIALMWSQETANNYASTVEQSDFTSQKAANFKLRGDHYTELMSFYDILTRAHLQFDIIDEVTVTEGLGKYDFVILPDCACLSDEAAKTLHDYVQSGGNLLSTFDSGFYQPDGTLADAPKLAALQGIAEAQQVISSEGPGMAYQRTGDSSLFDGIETTLLPFPRLALRCTAAPEAEVLSTALEPMPSCYVALPTTGFPGIIRNKAGKGTSIYIAGALGLSYSERSFPEYAKLIRNAAIQSSAPLFTTDAPETVEMVLRRQNGRIILHMINLTGEMDLPIRRIIPLSDIHITFQAGTKISQPYTLRGGNLETKKSGDGSLSVTLSMLKNYEIIVIPDQA